MALTLQQIVKRIETLSLAHKQIRSFFRGSPADFEIHGENIYPAVFCEKLPGSINRADHQQQYNFRLYFYDLINVAEGTDENELDVLSDMDLVANDILAMLMSYVYQDDYEIVDNSSEESRVQQTGDMVGGSVREIGIKVLFLADTCQVPTDDVNFQNTFDMARTKLITYTGTGAEGDSFSVADIMNSYVMAAYRAGQYRRVIPVVPTDAEKIQVVGVDAGSKGIFSTTGAVSLQVGDGLLPGEILDFLIYV